MAKCSAFHENPHNNGWDRCWATKETETCSCGGDDAKCDFYPEKRKKAAVPKFGEWISVKDRLPEDDQRVLFIPTCNQGSVYIGQFAFTGRDGGVMFAHRDGRSRANYYAKYWMPLPPQPKEG